MRRRAAARRRDAGRRRDLDGLVADMLKLHSIVEALGVDKLVLVGDRQQLSSIDAGKSFAMIQAAGGTLARMDENIRQRTDAAHRRRARQCRQGGEAMKVLGDNVHRSANPPEEAADRWLALGADECRDRGVCVGPRPAPSSTSASRTALPPRAPCGGGHPSHVYDRVNLTREELRYAATYRAGMTLDVGRGGAQDIGLRAGRCDVLVLPNGKVELGDGRRKIASTAEILADRKRDRLQLTEKKDLHVREGDRIRWTANDKPRGLHNAALARVIAVDARASPSRRRAIRP
jgi:hypothetical protein